MLSAAERAASKYSLHTASFSIKAGNNFVEIFVNSTLLLASSLIDAVFTVA